MAGPAAADSPVKAGPAAAGSPAAAAAAVARPCLRQQCRHQAACCAIAGGQSIQLCLLLVPDVQGQAGGQAVARLAAAAHSIVQHQWVHQLAGNGARTLESCLHKLHTLPAAGLQHPALVAGRCWRCMARGAGLPGTTCTIAAAAAALHHCAAA